MFANMTLFFSRARMLRLLLLLLWMRDDVSACTNLLVTPGASIDDSAMIAYNADSPTLYGVLYHTPPQKPQKKATMRNIFDWDTGRYMGQIEEPAQQIHFNVVGNGNDRGLVIGETTFGGVPMLAWNQSGAILDYGSLIYIALQRCQIATDAITLMADLMDTYGYASGGESFSITDAISGEVWIMEVISRGNNYGKRGAVWVAQRIPDGAVAAHANQARITTFARESPDFLHAEDVVDVAVFYGLYPATADPLLFSFSDVYDPLNFMSARQGEARVWSLFSQIADDTSTFRQEYESYAMGMDLSHRMPLYVIPYKKLSLDDVMQLMSSHYEGTKLDSSKDVGAGLFASPYRPRPLEWHYQNATYHNERSIATAKTGWNFIGHVRRDMPPELAVVLWFACDDSSTSPRVPVYASSTAIAPPYAGRGPHEGFISPLLQFDMDKAFWVQNLVSNFCYARWKDVYPVVRAEIDRLQWKLQQNVEFIDQEALRLYKTKGNAAAIALVTKFSVGTGNQVHAQWQGFFGELFVRFRDYYTILPKRDDPLCGCVAQEPGLSEVMKQRIVEATGDHYKVVESNFVDVRGGENGNLEADTMRK
jgi:dipeptidase